MSLSDVDAVTRVVGDRGRVAVTVASGETVRAGTRSRFTSVAGVLETTPQVFIRSLSRGAYLSRSDVDTARRVAVLGSTVSRELFGDRDPVGQQINIAGVRFRVVGVFAQIGQSLGVDRDDEVHIPVTTAHRLFGTNRIDGLAVKAPDRDRITQLGDRIVAELNRRHPDTEFTAVTQEQILGVLGDILGILTGVLAAIAGISLLVGGVGVSNIMLVSVRERTREIGLRKAVGARPRDISVQFLLEAVLLTTLGGVLGMGLGIGAALLAAALSPVPAAITWWSLALAFGVSATVGIVFGVVPAQRAGRLDPVVALRSE
jgi:putative ABC transport system permease protein